MTAIPFRLKSGSLRTDQIKPSVPGIPRGALTSQGGVVCCWNETGRGSRWRHRHLFENDTWLWLAASATPDPLSQKERMPACWDLSHNEHGCTQTQTARAARPTASITRMCAREMNYKVQLTDRYAFLGITYLWRQTNKTNDMDMQAIIETKLI